MNRKSLMMLGLLAAAPMASQAAMVEMDNAALSDVHGQGRFLQFAGNLSTGLANINTTAATAYLGPWANVQTSALANSAAGTAVGNAFFAANNIVPWY